MGTHLRHGPVGHRAVHLCVDMQLLFAPGGPWPAPWAARILPVVAALAEHAPARTIFTRFIPPVDPEAAVGTWRAYYRKWRSITREAIDPHLLDLVPELGWMAPPAHVVDKAHYSAFRAPALMPLLRQLEADTILFSGTETDVCVLASLFDAVDCGFRTIVVRDAVCSSSDAGHDAVLGMLHRRLSVQVEMADMEEIRAGWLRQAA